MPDDDESHEQCVQWKIIIYLCEREIEIEIETVVASSIHDFISSSFFF